MSRAVILHGGAGEITPELEARKLPVMKEALEAAWDTTESPLDAVVAALRILEASEYFNAGYGAYPAIDGEVTLDVGLMNGDGDFHSLLNVTKVKYPSLVARERIKTSKRLISVWHGLLEGEDPELMGGVSSNDEMIAPYVRQMLAQKVIPELNTKSSTVGCVVRDAQGNIAAGTSTGGILNKPVGRVGDSPLVGHGVYADNELGGLSTSGYGEAFISSNVSGYVLAEVRSGKLVSAAIEKELDRMFKRTGQTGGMIFLPAMGDPVAGYNSSCFSVGVKTSSKTEVSVFRRKQKAK